MPNIRFAGYAAIFNHRDRGGDIIRPSTFARTLKAPRDIPLLWQHQRGHVIGRIEVLAEDTRGLRVIARVADDDVAGALGEGKTTGLSFGYRVREGRGGESRELLDLDLVEVAWSAFRCSLCRGCMRLLSPLISCHHRRTHQARVLAVELVRFLSGAISETE